MYLEIKNFRNINNLSIDTNSKDKVFIFGNNGLGKTSTLEAIAYFSSEKYQLNRKALNYLKNNEKFFTTNFELASKKYSYWFLKGENKNQYYINDEKKSQTKLLDDLNIFFFETKKINNVLNYRQQRNDFFDFLLSKISPTFGEILLQRKKYNRLKIDILNSSNVDIEKLSFLNQKIQIFDDVLNSKRKIIIGKINNSIREFVLKHNIKISLKLDYNLIDKSNSTKDNDQLKKEDYLIFLNEKNIINFSSEGLSRITLLVVIFSIYDELLSRNQKQSILLLDDVFSHLDENNSSLLLEVVSNLKSVVFVTHQYNLLLKEEKTYLDKFFIKELR